MSANTSLYGNSMSQEAVEKYNLYLAISQQERQPIIQDKKTGLFRKLTHEEIRQEIEANKKIFQTVLQQIKEIPFGIFWYLTRG